MLVAPESVHWLYARRTRGWNEAGRDARRSEEHGNAAERHRIAGRHTEQLASDDT